MSVVRLDRRINNTCESFHAQYNKLVQEKHPGLYDFADYTNEMFKNYRMEFEKLLEDPEQQINRARRPGLNGWDAKLKQEERLLIAGHLTPMEFIESNVHSADGLIERGIGDENDVEEDDEQHGNKRVTFRVKLS